VRFAESIACTSGLHCYTCRARHAGAGFRASIASEFKEIETSDFLCPQHKPWHDGDRRSRYAEVLAAIRALPDTPPYRALRTEAAALDRYLTLHAARPECWKSRHRRRLIAAYQTTLKKAPCNPFAPSLQPLCIPPPISQTVDKPSQTA